ncbi:MAG TPA: hypothetical protein PL155_05675 [Candidatus Omnitrophota bacterium]|nr:hypothetical protein [Candidatus Omnitrophota bacterium]HPD84032.1 hypothetical protein [Candidatus Omnitrophota bacterium]HRZ02889.1 hypothetical protein [Candidatus Omnitrophota bacterium]
MHHLKTDMLFVLILSLLTGAGCSTVSGKTSPSVQNPREVETAVVAIKDAVTGEKTTAKYCPLCGSHYSGRVQTCPKDNTLLKTVEE